MAKSTLVSMYFNIKNLPDTSDAVRPIEFYLEKGKALLGLDNPLVFFCDSKTRPLIEEMRKELAPSAKTIYIEKDLVDYDFYYLNWPIIQKNRGTTYSGSRNTSSYFILTMFKFLALQIAQQRNDFGSSHYTWIDFGASHIAPKNFTEAALKMLHEPYSKIAVTYINYRSSEELRVLPQVGGWCGIAATAFTCEKMYIPEFYSECMSIFYQQLSSAVGHAEEQVMTYCYDRKPHLFTLIYGDYYSVLRNYHEPIHDYACIKCHFIDRALKAGRKDLAIPVIQKLLKLNDAGIIKLPDPEVQALLSTL
jgi:hypothetical protein